MGSCGSAPGFIDVFIDLENPSSSNPTERQHADEISNLVNSDLMQKFGNYRDAQAQTNAAISNPNEQTGTVAWDAVLPLVEFQGQVFDFASKTSQKFKELLDFLIASGKSQMAKNTQFLDIDYEANCVIVNAICEIAQLVFYFDSTKMRLPKLLGDLSYFRRVVTRRPDYPDYEALYAKSTEMTMFYANSSPLFSQCTSAIILSTEQDKSSFLTAISGLANSLISTIKNHKFSNEKTNIKCLSGITFAILLYDHISTNGAFHQKSPIHVRDGLYALKTFSPRQTELINIIKYSSKHLSDDSTPANIKDMLK
ncbi:putative protein FAM49B [Tritrichomonas foetus]|uniref:CYRIA/CYRIB Rac1 binding domain-containing protein n=1 Tax=Tritrichomonas foetus TaxID=1144522 RepID=A0A1J4KZC0_9EUKA|nr:putative protein FAM49B [Tritrichomonas foetus]|eukprot:OHT15036.1 putative protein FAM49B [Tritrichomonas foetus]